MKLVKKITEVIFGSGDDYIDSYIANILREKLKIIIIIFIIMNLFFLYIDYLVLNNGSLYVVGFTANSSFLQNLKYIILIKLVISALLIALIFYKPKNKKNITSLGKTIVVVIFLISLVYIVVPLFYPQVNSFSFSTDNTMRVATIKIALNGYENIPLVFIVVLAVLPLRLLNSLFYIVFVIGTYATVKYYLHPFIFNIQSDSLSTSSQIALMILFALISISASYSNLKYMLETVKKSFYDPLTHALNRMSGNEIIEKTISFAKREEEYCGILFMDLDHFKLVNDNFGHDIGDDVLKETVKTLHSILRTSDVVIRWGGEEFIVLLPNTSSNGIKVLVNKILEANLAMLPDGIAVTTSIGAAEIKNDGTNDIDDLIAIADSRMYISKKNGRNQATFEG